MQLFTIIITSILTLAINAAPAAKSPDQSLDKRCAWRDREGIEADFDDFSIVLDDVGGVVIQGNDFIISEKLDCHQEWMSFTSPLPYTVVIRPGGICANDIWFNFDNARIEYSSLSYNVPDNCGSVHTLNSGRRCAMPRDP